MKKNQYLARAETRGNKVKAIIALTLLMLGATILALLIQRAPAPAAVITTVGLWV